MKWQPGTDLQQLLARAELNQHIRAFMTQRGVMEVTVPVMGRHPVTALHLDSMEVSGGQESRFLQTSPEYFMKRLLAAGSGPIYSMAPAFRAGEQGALHNPEFIMLEWYQPGYSLAQLVQEVTDLLTSWRLSDIPSTSTSYQQLFELEFGVNPHSINTDELLQLAITRTTLKPDQLQGGSERSTRNNCLDQLFSEHIQPGLSGIVVVTDFPASQAALANVRENRESFKVAARFEHYVNGLELANGYDELTDPLELRQRFAEDNEERQAEGKAPMIMDEQLLAAMHHGIPAMAGVALGVDRLLLAGTGASSLDEVISFSDRRS